MPSLHQQACDSKRRYLQAQIDALVGEGYDVPLTPAEQTIHGLSLSDLVEECTAGRVTPRSVLGAYGKKTLSAHRLTNCISDFMFEEAVGKAEAEESETGSTKTVLTGEFPLLGLPVSLKDTINIAGHDTTVGLARNVGHPVTTSAPMVRLLQNAGAILHVKTTVPAALIGIETESDVFGLTTNPYNTKHGVGASTGGGGALLACGGSLVEIATDIGGSARIPAHYCGVYGLKPSIGRFPMDGSVSSMPGLESVQIVSGTMARRLDDLEEFWKRVVGMKPWTYDFTCVPVPWRSEELELGERKLKWGVIWEDGICPPTPACKRALSLVVESLKLQGHQVVDFTPPSISELLVTGYQLVFADGGVQMRDSALPGEALNPPLKSTISLLALPRFFKNLLAWWNRSTDPFYATLLESMHPKTIVEERELCAKRDEMRGRWHERWSEEDLDFVLTVGHPLPALENGTGEKASLISSGYTFMFNILDYTAGVLPVTFVDKARDALPAGFMQSAEYSGMNAVAKGVYSVYDAEKMHGLPLGVQVVGRRMEEEKVIGGMKIVESALKDAGKVFLPRVLV
ncbi:amidase signature domain-containing protein [Roridomyces roridus]|uniref:Amidase signature domain-containing protein n=1 Tax=Roridomyces roridus TaxID=1738132 RepID=A0AAD7B0S8_9AGAR|nr:amidase signature domain-containing protein [Roridomyces roridus]